ncbi:hypothetical protein [Sorangium sp. So ce385]|uniref:hypothetical protein n=1 Tax=Sorangium sp. So ce385 TaxID=3133308 RepID=UPI003F5CB744
MAALRAADEGLYARHAGDPRPNLLYDEFGSRIALDPDDPRQAELRAEWMRLYAANGGITEDVTSPPANPLGCVTSPCVQELASLTVIVLYNPVPTHVRGAMVELRGPTPKKELTDTGIVVFSDLVPGDYEIGVVYGKTNIFVDKSLTFVGSAAWAVNAERHPYPIGANKCNLFVYETANWSGYSVPRRTRFSMSRLETVWYPPLAGEWANDREVIGSWVSVSEFVAEPGDMVAEAVNYSDATGHVGLVAYPKASSASVVLASGNHSVQTVSMDRQCISAASDYVLLNDYFWSGRRHGTPHFKRYGSR